METRLNKLEATSNNSPQTDISKGKYFFYKNLHKHLEIQISVLGVKEHNILSRQERQIWKAFKKLDDTCAREWGSTGKVLPTNN